MTTRQVLQLLREYESRNVTLQEADGSWPVAWARARGVHVWDVEGRRYLDMTAAFGVASAGHANPAVVRAGQVQMGRLLHAMGDVHPHEGKARLARVLSGLTFGRWGRGGKGGGGRGKVIFGNSGFEAVEAALKTARLATGRRGIVAFTGGYHGLGYGALNATHRAHFRGPFLDQLGRFGRFVSYPASEGGAGSGLEGLEGGLRRLLRGREVGALLVEPVQARGGIRVPPSGFLGMLRGLCDEFGVLLVVDEIYTGFGRTGRWFAVEHSGVTPDLICLGKALTGGFPLSACVGRAEVMDAAWPPSSGEAIHTSTYLGHPVGCAMALAQVGEIRRLGLVRRAAGLGGWLLGELSGVVERVGAAGHWRARGLGLMVGMENGLGGGAAGAEVWRVVKRMLAEGVIVLPEGEHGEVLGFTPPLTVDRGQLERVLGVVERVLGEGGGFRRGKRA